MKLTDDLCFFYAAFLSCRHVEESHGDTPKYLPATSWLSKSCQLVLRECSKKIAYVTFEGCVHIQ